MWELRSVRMVESRIQRAVRKDHRRGGQQGWSRYGGRSLRRAQQQEGDASHRRDHLQAPWEKTPPPIRRWIGKMIDNRNLEE
jgi:hypothetical protein